MWDDEAAELFTTSFVNLFTPYHLLKAWIKHFIIFSSDGSYYSDPVYYWSSTHYIELFQLLLQALLRLYVKPAAKTYTFAVVLAILFVEFAPQSAETEVEN